MALKIEETRSTRMKSKNNLENKKREKINRRREEQRV